MLQKNVLKRYFATSISFQWICSITIGNCLRIQRIRSRNKALPYFDIHIVIIIMIVVCRNAKKRFDKPLFKWLWQNWIFKFNFAQHSLQWIRTNFKRNLLQNQRFCVETLVFRLIITIIMIVERGNARRFHKSR